MSECLDSCKKVINSNSHLIAENKSLAELLFISDKQIQKLQEENRLLRDFTENIAKDNVDTTKYVLYSEYARDILAKIKGDENE